MSKHQGIEKNLSANQEEILRLIQTLHEKRHEPREFADVRAKIFDLYFSDAHPDRIELLERLQSQLDELIAINGYTKHTVDQLLSMVLNGYTELVSAVQNVETCIHNDQERSVKRLS